MGRRQNPIPQLRCHSASGRAYARVDGRFHYFGKWGSEQAVEAYRRWVAEHVAAVNEPRERRASSQSPEESPEQLTVAGLVARYWRFIEATGRYTKNGEPTSERERVRQALDELLGLPHCMNH